MDAILPVVSFLAQSSADTDAVAGLFAIPFMCFFYVLMMLVYCLGPVLGILSMIFWIVMLVDVVQRKFENENDKILWVLIIALTGVIGAGVYYFLVKKKA